MSTAPARSLADDLRGRDDDQLRRLLQLRPDLLTPIPGDLTALAARSLSAPSIARALDSLDLWSMQVLEAIAVLAEPTSIEDVIAATCREARSAVELLIEHALLYRDPGQIRIPRAVREAFGPEPAGLGPRHSIDSRAALSELKKVPKESLAILDRMRWGPPRGTVDDINHASPQLQWLIDHQILQVIDQENVVLPGEIGLALRGGKVFRELHAKPPLLQGEVLTQQEIDQTGALEASAFMLRIEELLDLWAEEPPTALRSGGIGIRDLRRLAVALDIEEPCAAFVAESAYSIGLLGVQLDDQVLPTTGYDLWLAQEPSRRWQMIVEAWLISSRVSGLIGTKDSTSKSISALGPELDRAAASPVRKSVLELLDLAESMAPTTDSMVAAVAWRKPRRAAHSQRDLVIWSMREAAWLGMTGRGALTTFARDVIAGRDNSLDNALPPPVDHVLIQGDHTAIAPGPLRPHLLREMLTMAKIESRGSATVFRFTEDSFRHAFDTGASADDIQRFLTSVSKTPVPQSIQYLVNDVARKHGRLRVGSGLAYLRCDDENLLAEAIKDRRLAKLGLRRLAATVLISEATLEETLKVLRAYGYSPVAEGHGGAALVQAKARRASVKPKPPRMLVDSPPPNAAMLEAAVRALRAGDRAKSASRTAPVLEQTPSNPTSETVEALLAASQGGGSLWIGYADTDGGVSNRIVEPALIAGGYLTAFDHGTGTIRRFAIHRITGVAQVDA